MNESLEEGKVRLRDTILFFSRPIDNQENTTFERRFYPSRLLIYYEADFKAIFGNHPAHHLVHYFVCPAKFLGTEEPVQPEC